MKFVYILCGDLWPGDGWDHIGAYLNENNANLECQRRTENIKNKKEDYYSGFFVKKIRLVEGK